MTVKNKAVESCLTESPDTIKYTLQEFIKLHCSECRVWGSIPKNLWRPDLCFRRKCISRGVHKPEYNAKTETVIIKKVG